MEDIKRPFIVAAFGAGFIGIACLLDGSKTGKPLFPLGQNYDGTVGLVLLGVAVVLFAIVGVVAFFTRDC